MAQQSISNGAEWLLATGRSIPLDRVMQDDAQRAYALEALDDLKGILAQAQPSGSMGVDDLLLWFGSSLAAAFSQCALKTKSAAVLAGLDMGDVQLREIAAESAADARAVAKGCAELGHRMEQLLHAHEGVRIAWPFVRNHVTLPPDIVAEWGDELGYPFGVMPLAMEPEGFSEVVDLLLERRFGDGAACNPNRSMLRRKLEAQVRYVDVGSDLAAVVPWPLAKKLLGSSESAYARSWGLGAAKDDA